MGIAPVNPVAEAREAFERWLDLQAYAAKLGKATLDLRSEMNKAECAAMNAANEAKKAWDKFLSLKEFIR